MFLEKAAILAQRFAQLLPIRQMTLGALLLGLPALGVVTAFGIVPGAVTETILRTTIVETVPLPEFAPPGDSPEQQFASQERVLRGDTVAALLARLGVSDPSALDFMRGDSVGRQIFRQLIPGRTIEVRVTGNGSLVALRYFVSSAT